MLSPAITEALAISQLPEIKWLPQDDLCDCTYQRIGMWTNPYLAETLEVRMCCIWEEIYAQYPQYVRKVPAFWDYNENEWVTQPMEWNGEADMPVAIWHRQLARSMNISIQEARDLNAKPPAGKARELKPLFFLPCDGEYIEVTLG